MIKYINVLAALILSCLALFSTSVSAKFNIAEFQGWELGGRGRLSINCSITDASNSNDGLYGTKGTNTTCGIGRTLLPSEIGATLVSPVWESPIGKIQANGVVDLAYTVNFHEDGGTGTEIRNGYIKVSLTPESTGPWSLTLGNQLSSFGDVILLDHTLNGVGVPAGPDTVDTTGLGHIGTGYLFDLGFSFGAKLETATFHGFNLELGVYNASTISGLNSSPRFEGQLNYVQKIGGVDIKSWVTGLYQSNHYRNRNIDIFGVDGGVSVEYGPFGAFAYGYGGHGIGAVLLNKTFSDTVNTHGDELVAYGGLSQVHYNTELFSNHTKLALSYGLSAVDKSAIGSITNRQSLIVGGYMELTPHINFFIEGGHAWSKVIGGSNASDNFGNAGFNLNF